DTGALDAELVDLRVRAAAMSRAAILALAAAGIAFPASADPFPAADKVMVLVSAAGCDAALLSPRLDAVGRAMAADRRTIRVSIDRPADPTRNLDLLGKSSPFAAAIEV